MQRALFLDRDGVLNVDHHYISRPDRFDVIDGVFDALRHAQSLGYALIIVTNQSGIARGYFTAEDYAALELYARDVFAVQGILFTGIYHCPHHPEGRVPPFSGPCDCRKPQPGMILRAAQDHDLDLTASVLVGDKRSDILAAHAAGVGRAYLLDPPHFTLKDVLLD